MANRKAFNLRYIMVVYNFFQIVVSTYMFLSVITQIMPYVLFG